MMLQHPPFSFCFKLSVMVKMWEGSFSQSHAHTDMLRQGHTADTVTRVILTHVDMPTEMRFCVHIITHNYAPYQMLMHIDFSQRAD